MAETTSAVAADTLDEGFARQWFERFTVAWNSHDAARLVALAVEDVRWANPYIHPDGVVVGHAALRAWLDTVWRAVPDLQFAVVGAPLVSLDGERVGAHWTGRGTFTGVLDPPGFAPTGGAVRFEGFDLHRFRDGRLAEVVSLTDTTAFAREVGAAPRAGSRGERLAVRLQRLGARRARRGR